MKIAFLCGSLEPGRDGVGDYTRRLAGELMRQGHQPVMAALNDMHLTEKFVGTQRSENLELPVMRVPSTWPATSRFECVKTWLDSFNPEILSLQFVLFSFQPKGLPIGIDKYLLLLGKGRRWHVMFHELWVGMAQNASLKLVFLGSLQRLLIRALLKSLNPTVVHTQTKLYQSKLKQIGVEARYLALFSNIPVSTNVTTDTKQLSLAEDTKVIYLVIFGGIHSDAPVAQFAEEAARYSKQHNKELILRIVGRCGAEQEHWVTTWKAAGLSVEVLGEQPPEKISHTLTNSSIGISTTPFSLIEKSGAVAAMREHKLPVVCVRNAWKATEATPPSLLPGIIEYQVGYFHELPLDNIKIPSTSTLSAAAEKLLLDISYI